MGKLQVRHVVNEVDGSIRFHCVHLGFHEIMHHAPPFASLERGDLRLVLCKPNPTGGSGPPMPDAPLRATGA